MASEKGESASNTSPPGVDLTGGDDGRGNQQGEDTSGGYGPKPGKHGSIRYVYEELEKVKCELERYKKENELLRSSHLCRSTAGSTSSLVELNGEQKEPRSSNTRFGMAEIKNILPEFNPTKITDGYNINQWIKLIENVRQIYMWDETSTLLYATLRLGGAANLWYKSNYHKINNWEHFKGEIMKSFPQIEDDATVLMQIMNRRRGRFEPIEDYFYSVTALASKIDLPEASVVQYIISGLNDEPLSNSLVTANCTDLQELMLRIKRYEEFKTQDKQRKILQENEHVKRKRDQGPSSRSYKRLCYETNRNEEKQIRKEVVCFKCHRKGHFASKCKESGGERIERMCFKCKQVGHLAKDCTINKVQHIQEDEGVTRDEYHKEIEIDGKLVIAFLDFGSDCTTMKKSLWETYGWNMEPCETLLTGFGGEPRKALGRMNKMIKCGEIQNPIDIKIVEDKWQSPSVILGRNFLDKPNVKIIKTWKSLQLINSKEEEEESGKDRRLTPLTIEDIKVDEVVSLQVRKKLLSLLNRFRDCFAKNTSELGKTDMVHMKTELSKNEIINYRPYKVAYGLKNVLEETIEELIKNDIIQVSTSPYASPVLFVPKPNGEYRMCIDYRKINAITKRENFPLPNIEETLNSLAGKEVFTALDLFSGYHQIPIEASSRKYTAFVTSGGHYEYKRVPFGPTNSPAVFLRLMHKVFNRLLKEQKVIIYMDDILIATKTVEENLEILSEALVSLKEVNLTLKPEKCLFLTNKIKFLGHEISAAGIQPGSTKVCAIEKYDRPTNVTEVRKFIGLTSYFRKFIKNFAQIATPLHRLLKKNVKFEWNESCEKSFQTLKSALVSRPTLTLYDSEKEHELHTDASARGIAGILFQRDSDGLKPVSYFSRTTTTCEEKYHSYELETLAVVESIERFRHYLLLKKFKVVTDCNSLKVTKEKKNILPRIARWWLKISEFDFTLEHRSGNQLRHVDALSRTPVEKGQDAVTVAERVMKISSTDEDWIATLQQQDTRIREIKAVLDGSNSDHPEKDAFKGCYVLRNNRIYKLAGKEEKLVIPKYIRWRIIKMAHDESAHCGLMKTINNIQKHFWFPRMKQVVKKYLSSCIDCLYYKRGNDETNYQLHTPSQQPIPFNTVHIDHIGPYPRSKKGNVYLIGIVDSFTKFLFLKATKAANTKGVIQALEEMVQFVGMPAKIISDRGTAFTSREFTKFCEDNGAQHILTAVQTPRANGQVERFFRTVKTAIATLTQNENGNDWDQHIKEIQWSLNSMVHSTTKKSPQQLLFDYTPRNILGNKLVLALQDEGENSEDDIPLATLREKVLMEIRENQQRQAERFNKTHKSPRRYNVGELVLIRQEIPALGISKKTQPRYKGPYQVAEVLGNDRYVVKDPDTGLVTQKPYKATHAADRMKPWCKLEDMNLVSEDETENETGTD